MECGSVARAARLAGIHRSTHYEWLESDEAYAAVFPTAYKRASDALLDACVERAQVGWSEYVVSAGEIVYLRDAAGDPVKPLKRKRYSDSLLALLIKGRIPQYQDAGTLNVRHTHDFDLSTLTDEELDELERLTEKTTLAPGDPRRAGPQGKEQAGPDVPGDGTSAA